MITVVKVGSSSICSGDEIDDNAISIITSVITKAHKYGNKVILVTSWAVNAGEHKAGYNADNLALK